MSFLIGVVSLGWSPCARLMQRGWHRQHSHAPAGRRGKKRNSDRSGMQMSTGRNLWISPHIRRFDGLFEKADYWPVRV
jgi:hypothetical protein